MRRVLGTAIAHEALLEQVPLKPQHCGEDVRDDQVQYEPRLVGVVAPRARNCDGGQGVRRRVGRLRGARQRRILQRLQPLLEPLEGRRVEPAVRCKTKREVFEGCADSGLRIDGRPWCRLSIPPVCQRACVRRVPASISMAARDVAFVGRRVRSHVGGVSDSKQSDVGRLESDGHP